MSLRPPKRVKDLLMVNWNIFWISLRYFCWISRAQMCMEWMDAHLKFLFAVTKYQKELVKILCGRRSHHWLNSGGRKEVQDTRQGTRMAVDAVVASIKRRAQTITTFEDIAEVHVRSFHSCISFILSIFYLFWPFFFLFPFPMKFGTAAANRDREIGELIAKAFEKGWGNDLQFLAVSSFLNSSSSLLSICCACEPAFTFQFLPFCLLSFFFPDWFAMFYL